ncbi:efflux RND transporter permease subunit [Dethiobacter alkaliphilus]|uniref:Acriflavin resistance protein n=1 Tax=Dethiobacter alkaliphilus AHT 1 TaxID=555088 RepID=C0GIH2_DETAL|nr:efflux RND transporter permease subunit [Dethiobacter alkaliphilus]EEG76833.1 acriflavin resistance protein [Dethiobacter alkaliphilus AHT 1]
MNLPSLAIRRPIAVLMAVCIVLVLGGFAFLNLPVDLLPEMEFPVIAVVTGYDGAAPEEVENMVTRPLEQILATVPGVERISSTSSQGNSVVVLQFNWGSDMDFRALDVRERVDRVVGYLPDDVDSPLMVQADPSMMPVVSIAITGDMGPADLKRLAEDTVQPRLERIDGVASVDVIGGIEREIRVVADPARLAAYGLTLDQLGQIFRMENLNVSAGTLAEGGQELQVRTLGQFSSLSDLENLVLHSSERGTVYLRDVAEVQDTHSEQEQLLRLNGTPGVGLNVSKQSDANTVTVAGRIDSALQELSGELPTGSEAAILFNQADFINDSIGDVLSIGLAGAVLAVFILFMFLRNVRSTLVIGLAIPVSIISTFVLMFFNNLTLNLITLGGLALGIGMMVDNAIVILENIFRLRQEGMEAKEAAAVGSNEVADAIIAATLTTVVVFLPVIFVEGIASQIFSSMAWTVSFALFASLAVALTIIPLLSSRLLQVSVNNNEGKLSAAFERGFKRVESVYGRLLRWAMTRRKIVIGVMLLAFAGSVALVPWVGTEFIPGMDDGWLTVSVRLPDGATLNETEALTARAEERLEAIPEVDYVFSTVGAAGGSMGFSGGGAANRSSVDVRLTPLDQRRLDNDQVADEVRQALKTLPGAEITVQASQGMSMGGSGVPVDIMVKGDSLETLRHLTEEIRLIVEGVEGTREAATSFDRGWPELQVTVDREKAAAYGLQSITVANTLRTALSGQVVTRFRTGSQELDVRLFVPEEMRQSISMLQDIEVVNPAGSRIPLGEVADFARATGPVSISRDDQVRSARVTAQLAGRALGPVMADIQRQLDNMELPSGYSIEYAGEQELMADSFDSLWMALALAVLLVYMIMAAQFESLLHPFIIMFALPQTFIGVVLALVITGRTLNVPAFIGVIMLAGIVVNNAIVLVDYINKLRERGLSTREAIYQAGPIRLRPILMTTLTTILGMFPLALGIGSGSETSAPLATVVIGGLAASTVLTLVVVPVIYSLLEDMGTRFFKKKKSAPGEVSA